MNNFTFNSKHYLQKHGMAMGTKMAPSYANLFLGKFEHDALLNSPYQPHIWLRFIDDIFVVSLHSTGETYHIKSHITCTTFNVIYMIQCRLCNLSIILTIYTPPLTSHARILLLIYHSLMSWFLSRMAL